VVNNIVAFNGYGMYEDDPARPFTPSHNCVYGNTTDYSGLTADDTNIAQNPRLVDYANGDVHLVALSPCIDAGDDSALMTGDLDTDSQSRTNGEHVDIGADEFSEIRLYNVANVIVALRLASGIGAATVDEIPRLNVEATGLSSDKVDLLDAIRIARKAAGLEANP
jgi:hypothetical protein